MSACTSHAGLCIYSEAVICTTVWRRSSGLRRPTDLLSRIFVPVPSGRGASQGHPCGIAGRETAYVWTGTRTPRGQMPAATRKKKGSPAAADSAEAVSEETAGLVQVEPGQFSIDLIIEICSPQIHVATDLTQNASADPTEPSFHRLAGAGAGGCAATNTRECWA